MQHLEGETLRERLAVRASLQTDPLLDPATQIADGLDAARATGKLCLGCARVRPDHFPSLAFVVFGPLKCSL